jgi:hypothetical protein
LSNVYDNKISLDSISPAHKIDLWRDVYSSNSLHFVHPPSPLEKSIIEKELFTFNIEYDIMELVKEKQANANEDKLFDLAGEDDILRWGVVRRLKLHTNKDRGETMAFVVIDTTDGVVEDVPCFYRTWAKIRNKVKEGGGGLFYIEEKLNKKTQKLTRHLRDATSICWPS